MRKFILLTLLLFATPAFGLEADKVAHLGLSAAYGFVAGTVIYHKAEELEPAGRMLTSTGIALVPGIACEIADRYFREPHHFGWDDMLSDTIGAVTGSVAAELFNGQFWISASGKQIRLIGKW